MFKNRERRNLFTVIIAIFFLAACISLTTGAIHAEEYDTSDEWKTIEANAKKDLADFNTSKDTLNKASSSKDNTFAAYILQKQHMINILKNIKQLNLQKINN